jgi:anti-sigma B factor antagonist
MPTSSFGLDVFAGRDTRVVAARGRLVAGAGADAREWASAAASGLAQRVVLDLTAVTALDAGGIGRLLLVRQALAGRGAHLTIAAATPRVWRVLELTGLDRVLAPGRDPRDREDAAADITSAAGTLCRCA